MQSKQSIVTLHESSITLHTGLSSRQFANAKMGQYITEAGIFISIHNDEVTTEEFRFTDTKTIAKNKNDEIVLTNDSIEGTTLLSLLENKSETTLKTLETLSSIIEWSFENNIYIPNCGPEGTIITENGIFFLPFELFERSMLAQNKETTSLLYGCWINNALNDIDSWRFTLSTYVYTALSREKPFQELDREKRSADYYDNNFIPLNLLVEVDGELANIVNHNLSLTGKAHTSIKPQKQKSKAETIVTQLREKTADIEISSIPLPLSMGAISAKEATPEILKERNQFIEKKSKHLRKIRFLRKNSGKLIAASLLCVTTCFFAGSIIQSHLSKPTTEGMTPIEVVQTFYNSLNTLDNVTLDSCGTSNAIGNYSNMVATIYVSGKMRETYERTASLLPPAQWIGTNNPLDLSVFGLTNIEINQKGTSSTNPKVGDTAHFLVTFYTLASKGENTYDVSYSSDTLALEYGRKHWQIVNLKSETSQTSVASTQFIEDLTITRSLIKEDSTIETYNQGALLTEALREAYPWLPTVQEVTASVELIPLFLLEN